MSKEIAKPALSALEKLRNLYNGLLQQPTENLTEADKAELENIRKLRDLADKELKKRSARTNIRVM